MKKMVLCLLGVFILQGMLIAEEEPSLVIAVMDFENNGLEAQEVRLISDYITSALVRTEVYDVIDRNQRDMLLAEIEFSYSGVSNEEAQIELGKLLAADLILTGSIGKLGSRYIVNISVIDVRTSKNIASDSAAYPSIDALLDGSVELVYSLALGEPLKVDTEHTFTPENDMLVNQNTGDKKGPNALLLTLGGVSAAGAGVLTYFFVIEQLRKRSNWTSYMELTTSSENDSNSMYDRYVTNHNNSWVFLGSAVGAYAVATGFFLWAAHDAEQPKNPEENISFAPSFNGGGVGLNFSIRY